MSRGELKWLGAALLAAALGAGMLLGRGMGQLSRAVEVEQALRIGKARAEAAHRGCFFVVPKGKRWALDPS